MTSLGLVVGFLLGWILYRDLFRDLADWCAALARKVQKSG